MTRRKTPQEKKADVRSKDVRYRAVYNDKSDRKNRPRSKAREQRATRRSVQAALRMGEDRCGSLDPIEVDDAAKTTKRYQYRRYSTAVDFTTHLSRQKQYRCVAVADKYFREPYCSDEHREPFIRFLQNVVDGGTEDSYQLALLFERALSRGRPQDYSRWWWSARDVWWLHRFFEDVPEWGARIEAWQGEVLGQEMAG